MRDSHRRLLETLEQSGWTVRYPAEAGTIPDVVRSRYPWIPQNVWDFISGTEEVTAPDQFSWCLSYGDYHKTTIEDYAWNAWELLGLGVAERSPRPGWSDEITAFWDEHFPIILTVQPFGYGYAAIRKPDGAVVAGWGPDFETPFGVIADSFDELLELLPGLDPEMNIASLLPPDDE